MNAFRKQIKINGIDATVNVSYTLPNHFQYGKWYGSGNTVEKIETGTYETELGTILVDTVTFSEVTGRYKFTFKGDGEPKFEVK